MKIKLLHTLVIAATSLLLACNGQQENEENEQAFTEYKTFVTETENRANTELTETEARAMRQSAMDTSLWQKESAELNQDFESRKNRVDANLDSYDEARRKEIADLEQRYNVAVKKQEEKYRNVSRRYRLRSDLLGLPVNADDMSSINAAALPGVYERFVERLNGEAENLEQSDWEMVEGWWLALNNRRNELQGQLNTNATATINRASEKYEEIRTKYVTAP